MYMYVLSTILICLLSSNDGLLYSEPPLNGFLRFKTLRSWCIKRNRLIHSGHGLISFFDHTKGTHPLTMATNPWMGKGGFPKTNDCLVTVSWCLWLIMHVTSAVWWMSFLKQNHKFFLYPILWAGSHTINPPKVNGTILCCSDSILHLAMSIKYYGDWCRTVKMVKLNSQALTLVQ